MATYKIKNSELNPKKLKDKFDLYGRWSISDIDMSEPGSVMINEKPQDWCSNSFIRINFKDDGINLYDAHPGYGKFIAKIFEFEKTRPVFDDILGWKEGGVKFSERKVIWSNRTSQEVLYNWRTGVKHKYLISACFPAIRCTVIDSFDLAIQLKCDYIENIGTIFKATEPYYILWSKSEKDTPIILTCPSGFSNIQLKDDILLLYSGNDRFFVHVGPLFGAALINTKNIQKIPGDWKERAQLIMEGSCNMPVDFKESYDLDNVKGRVKISRYFKRSRISSFEFDNKNKNISIYPPSVFYPKTGGRPESGNPYDIYTLYGKTYFTSSEYISYSFDVPPEIDQRLAIPDLDEVKGDFEINVVALLNTRISKELEEVQELPKFESSYAFFTLAQQMLACHSLLKEDIKKKLTSWTRKNLEYIFENKWVEEDFYGFSYPEGHWIPFDIDCYYGNIFLCITHYVEASDDIGFVKNIFPKIKKMLNYFKISLDPMTSNGFSGPDRHINWISDTLETVAGLFGIARIARFIGDDIWKTIVGYAVIYRCGAVGLLFGREIYNATPGLPTKESWLFDHWDCRQTMLNWFDYPLACAIAVDATRGFIPLAYEKSFWHLYLPFWPLCPELCLLHLNLNWEEKFLVYFRKLEENWPEWRISPEATFAHGAPFLIFIALYKYESREEVLKQYLQGESVHKTRPFLEFVRWKHFIMACLLVDPDNPIKKQDKLKKIFKNK